jgi:hypothetical protein
LEIEKHLIAASIFPREYAKVPILFINSKTQTTIGGPREGYDVYILIKKYQKIS